MSLMTMLRRAVPVVGAPTIDIATLPDATLTPNERAWTTLWYIESHRNEWDQSTFGMFTDKSQTATVGCFAHHLCKTAGYERFGCYTQELARTRNDLLTAFYSASCARLDRPCGHADWVETEHGWTFVTRAANNLLGVSDRDGHARTMKLFSARNSIRDLRRQLPKLVGPEPRHRH